MSWIALLVLVACAPEEESEKEAPPINSGDGTVEDCDASAPVIEALTVYNAGMYDFGDEGGEWPTIKVDASVTDADGDLTTVRMDIWIDDVVDGAVDTSVEPTFPGDAYAQDDAEACSIGSMPSFSTRLGVAGGSLQFDTLYEFGVITYDAHALASDLAIASGYTPKEDGTDGGT